MGKNRTGLILIFIAILIVVSIAYLYSVDVEYLNKGGRDKVLHFFIFYILGYFSASIGIIFSIILLLMGVVLEYLQRFMPPRHFEMGELILNLVAAVMGMGTRYLFLLLNKFKVK